MTDPNEPDAPLPAEQPADESAPEWTLPNTAGPTSPAAADDERFDDLLLGVPVE